MKARYIVSIFMGILVLAASFLPGCSCGTAEAADSYMAVIPATLHANSLESMAVSLFSEGKPVKDNIEVTLLQDGAEVQTVSQTVNGKGTIDLNVPELADGTYQINVKGSGFDKTADVTVENSFLIFLETDKPIYKPGQTMHIRAITLNADLIPVQGAMTIEVLDAKGIKIFRKDVESNDFGLVSLDLPLSTEPNLGVWKLSAVTEKGETQTDVRVEEYVLPKYEVNVDLAKDWFLVNEDIPGTVSAEYSFGKPVKGDLEIVASRYVGEWQRYTVYSGPIDGMTDFTIDAPGYVAGVPAAGGNGNVILDVTVTEQSTGYTEKTSSLLTVTDSSVNLQIIPESTAFKPGLPLSLLFVTETPANQPLDASINVEISYLKDDYSEAAHESKTVSTSNGKVIMELTPPENIAAMTISAQAESNGNRAYDQLQLVASYSPSGNFIHVEQTSEGTPALGQPVTFKVYSTRQAVNFYYEVVSRGRVVFSDYTTSTDIRINTTPEMSPTARLIVYQILPNSEVAADYVPFNVEVEYPNQVTAEFSKPEAAPGESVDLNIDADGASKVGIAAVDRSVFILAENRLNLQQVFDELEKLYMTPQVELHSVNIYPSITTRGALDVFDEAGVIVLSNNDIPEGKVYESPDKGGFAGGIAVDDAVDMAEESDADAPTANTGDQGADGGAGLAEVERVRQFFPETWLWDLVDTDASGKASMTVTVPDTITTWMVRAVAISKEKGLGVAETSLKAFQPFFTKVDLPYSAIRGEEFPVSVAVYNYLDSPQDVQVDLDGADWFDLLDDSSKTITVPAGEVGGADFMIRTKTIGTNELKVTARSTEAADAVIQTVIVEPEGVANEVVQNITLSPDLVQPLDTTLPETMVTDSGRTFLALTGSYLTQTIDGLDALIQMPFGCGEQNMIVFAPDVYITKYLRESNQLKPEIMAKAEKLMITGYQRELTYRHSDGSFSAFGESDESGSLWLTAFVLKSFAQAKGIIYIDDEILSDAAAWIISHQNSDGSFDQVGFVHHQELLGGLQGKDALTAFTAIALLEAGETTAANRAVGYLEEQLGSIDDAYTLALTAYAMELSGSGSADEAYAQLMDMAIEDENGLHWGTEGGIIPLAPAQDEMYMPADQRTADVEITGYATLALNLHGDAINASRAAKWLVSNRNAYGGYGSTQDTVVALQALTEYSAGIRADVDLTVQISGEGISKNITIDQSNFDVLQIVELPVDTAIELQVAGNGEAIAQLVKRYNMPDVDYGDTTEILSVNVRYDTTNVAVNDLVKVSASVSFNPVEYMEAGMVVLDVSVPTGFAPVIDSIAAIVDDNDNIKRYDVAGRKVIFYIENMMPGDTVSFSFYVKAQYPVKAKAVTSQAYSYYQPAIKAESLGPDVTVTD